MKRLMPDSASQLIRCELALIFLGLALVAFAIAVWTWHASALARLGLFLLEVGGAALLFVLAFRLFRTWRLRGGKGCDGPFHDERV